MSNDKDQSAESAIVAHAMQQLAGQPYETPAPLAAAIWWRLSLRQRQEQVRRAQAPLIWMGRISHAAVACTLVLIVATMPNPSQPAALAGLMALGAILIPVGITLWGWSRSKN